MRLLDTPLLLIAAVLTVGQGRVALKSFRTGQAGWGRIKYTQSTNPSGYLAMAWFEVFLFAALCLWLAFGARQLLQ